MSDDKIVPFKPKAAITVHEHDAVGGYAWVCWCGCSEFKLREAGSIECWTCGQIQPTRYFMPEEPVKA